MRKRKEFVSYCYDKEFIDEWKDLEAKYATNPDITSDNMVDMLVDAFGYNCFPVTIEVKDDYIKTTFKLNHRGEIV